MAPRKWPWTGPASISTCHSTTQRSYQQVEVRAEIFRVKTKKANKVDKEISTVKKQLPSSGGQSSLPWGLRKKLPSAEFNMKSGHLEAFVSVPSGLPKNSNSLAARMRNQSSMPHSTVGSTKVMGQQQFDFEGAKSPSEQSPLQQQSLSVPVTTHHAPSVRNLAEQGCQQNCD
ncbi:hypothetical protein KIW84_056799 [Lathyrus oleraceus]|uniref:Uncharacterized protein n=1 Tax=Pisum sativum TaxID=3888 RepID=A0A9D4X471_PEA|nr:hypothetical protein KIW84_056799 [Pisum sativum]